MAPDAEPPAPRPRRCPRCGRPTAHRFRPFCSAACRDHDLLAWLDGRYAVPAVEVEPEDEPPPESPPAARQR